MSDPEDIILDDLEELLEPSEEFSLGEFGKPSEEVSLEEPISEEEPVIFSDEVDVTAEEEETTSTKSVSNLNILFIIIFLIIIFILLWIFLSKQTDDQVVENPYVFLYVSIPHNSKNINSLLEVLQIQYHPLNAYIQDLSKTYIALEHSYPVNPRNQQFPVGSHILVSSLTFSNEKPGEGRIAQPVIFLPWYTHSYRDSFIYEDDRAEYEFYNLSGFSEHIVIANSSEINQNNSLVYNRHTGELVGNGVFQNITKVAADSVIINDKRVPISVFNFNINSTSSFKSNIRLTEYVEYNNELKEVPVDRSIEKLNQIRKKRITSCKTENNCCNTSEQENIPKVKTTVAKLELENLEVFKHMKKEYIVPEVDGVITISGNPHPSPIITYGYEKYYPEYLKQKLRTFYAKWNKMSCIKLIEDTGIEKPTIIHGGANQCTSTVGWPVGGSSNVNLGYLHTGPTWCWDSESTIYHETIHALGWSHTQNTRDRDLYIVSKGDALYSSYTRQGLHYDYNSIMHYSGYESKTDDYKGSGKASWDLLPGTVLDLYKQVMIYCLYNGKDIKPDTFLALTDNDNQD